MSLRQKANALHELTKPLTYEELDALLDTDEYAKRGMHIWVKRFPDADYIAAILDWNHREILAVCGASIDGEDFAYYGRDYGKTWVAYRTPPVFEE